MNRRLDLGLFQRDVAHEIEVDTETVYRWESNESTPQIQFFSAFIKFLNYNPLPLPGPRQRLVFYRQTFGLSQRALATKVGVGAKALGLSERGKLPLSKKLLKLLESL